MAASRTYSCTVIGDASMWAIPVPFDPKAEFGKVRAPVVVTLNGYRYRSTIAAMGGPYFVPLRKSHRDAAGVAPGDAVDVTLTLDEQPRDVTPPADLVAALESHPGAKTGWEKLSYTHRREHAEAIESAAKPETRARRIDKAVAMAVDRSKR